MVRQSRKERKRPEAAPVYPRTKVALAFPKITEAESYYAASLVRRPAAPPSGGAVDIHLDATDPGRRALGDSLFRSLRKKAGILEVDALVWNGKIWSKGGGGPREYPGEHPHDDRLHVEFKRHGARQTMLIEIEVDLAMMRGG